MTLEAYRPNSIIVEQGSPGDKFYYVLKGKVQIYIKAFNSMTGSEFFKHAADLPPGAHFGELSLIYNCPRTASVVSGDECKLIVVSKHSYNILVRKYHVEHLNTILRFYQNFPLFSEAE